MESTTTVRSCDLSIDRKRAYLIPLILFMAAAIVIFLPVLLPNDPVDYTGLVDMSLYFGPNLYFLDHCVHVQGELPLWNPLILCGTPFAANPQTLTFYPLNLIRSLLTFSPTPIRTLRSFTFLVWFHLVLVGAGVFFLARSHRLHPFAAFAAAMVSAFSFSSLHSAQINPALVMTAAWFPYILLGMRKALTANSLASRLRLAVLAGMAYAMAFLAGFSPYMGAISVAMAVYYILHRLVSMFGSRGHKSWAALPGGIRRDVPVLLVIVTVGVLLAAALLVPCAEFMTHTTRAADSPTQIEKRQPGQEVGHSPLFVLMRLAFYAPVGGGFRPMGAGVSAMLLAFFAVWHGRGREALVYLGILYVLIDCSGGPPFPLAAVLQRLTPFQMSNPDYLAVLCPIPLSILVAFGLDALAVGQPSSTSRKRRAVFVAMSAALLAIVFIYAYTAPPSVNRGDQLMDLQSETAIPWPAMAGAATAFLAVFVSTLVGGRALLLVLIVGSIFLETYAASRTVVPYPRTRTSMFGLPEPALQEIRQDRPGRFWEDNNRYNGLYWNGLIYELKATPTGYDPLHLASTYRLLAEVHHKSDLDQRFIPPVIPARPLPLMKRAFWLAPRYALSPLPSADKPYPITTVVFLEREPNAPIPKIDVDELARQPISDNITHTPLQVEDSDFSGVFSASARGPDSGPRLVEKKVRVARPAPLHSVLRVWIRSEDACQIAAWASEPVGGHYEHLGVHHVTPTQGTAATIAFPLPDWDNAEVALQVKAGDGEFDLFRAELIQDLADEGKFIKVVHRSANSIRIDVDCPGERLLLFTDALYPGWKAFVDGEPVEILRANDAFKAVVLSSGRHAVEFVFQSRTVWIGISVSAAALTLTVAGLLILGRME